MTSSPLKRILTAAVAVCALAPATASAASISMEGGALVYRADDSGSSVLVTTHEDWETKEKFLSLSLYGGTATTNTDQCRIDDVFGSMAIRCTFDPNRPLILEGGASKDDFSVYSAPEIPDSMPITMRGNGGDDKLKDVYNGNASRTLEGGPGADTIEGWGGNDILDGGDGNDKVDGGAGNDQVRGGNGEDVLIGDGYKAAGADVLDGGPGIDMIEDWTDPSADVHPTPTITIDGVANDGRPGEGDNVISVEKLKQYISTSFTGSDAAEDIEIWNPAEPEVPNTLIGMGGNDRLVAHDAPDTVDGGTGDDTLEGGFGDDTITGGPGKDKIFGDKTGSHCGGYSCKVPWGNDTINAKDGEVDSIDCGVGEDTAYVDANDVVSNCERVEKSGGPSGPSGPSGPAGPGGPSGPGSSDGLSVTGSATRKALLGGKLGVKLDCAAACEVTAKATVSKKDAKKLRLKSTTVGTGRTTLLAAGTASVKIKLGAKTKKALKKAKKGLKITINVSTTGADGKTAKLKRSVTLK